MYVQFFRLSEAPFSITPDPAFLYLSPRHHEALAHLLYGTGDSGGFVALTGEVGTGKTTVLRTLLQQKLPEVDAALILNPRQDEHEFLQSICDELGVAYPEGRSIKHLVDGLNRYLLDAHSRGRRTVLIIDEAQNLSETLLEQIRLLTNLETHKQKLLRIMLVGQPELNELLARPSMRQLAQRITARFHLTALDVDETAEYIAHRLRVAGGDADTFEPRAMRAVYRASGGIPRLINVICDRAMLAAYTNSTRHITAPMVREAARQVVAAPAQKRSWKPLLAWFPRVPWIPGVAVAGMLGAAFLLTQWTRGDLALPFGAAESASAISNTAEMPASPERTATTTAPPLPDSIQRAERVSPAFGNDDVATDPERLVARLPSLGDQVEVLLGLWDSDIEIGAGTPVCDAIEGQRLRCLRTRGGWEDLQRFDRPAILTLVSGSGETHYGLLTGLDADNATMLIEGKLVTTARDTLDMLWNGDIFLVWQSRFAERQVIRPGDSGAPVQWLRTALATATGTPLTDPPDEVFDNALRQDVEAFQRRHGLEVDGHVGEQTKLVLMQEAPESNGPTLYRGP